MTGRTGSLQRLAAILIAVVAALAVVPVKSWLNDAAHVDIGFIPALAAVVVAAWLGGFLPGVIATALGIVVEATVFMEPQGSLTVDGERIRLVLFGLTGVLASWLAWLRTSAEARAQAASLSATTARERSDLVARRLVALQALAEQLAGAATADQIVDLVLSQAMTALQADGGAVFLLEPGDDELVAVAWHGYDEARARSLQRLPLTIPMPATDVARTGEPVFIEDPDEYAARYREPLEARGLAVEPRSVAVVPLEVEGRQFGAVGFTWNGPHDLPADRRSFIAAIARLGAAAMDRARLFDAERRHAAELEAVVAAIGEAILVAEPDGTIRASNAAAATLLGGGGLSVEAFLGSLVDADGDPPRRLPTGPAEYRLARRPTSWVEVTSYPVASRRGGGTGRPRHRLSRRLRVPPGPGAAGGVPRPVVTRAPHAGDDDLWRCLRARPVGRQPGGCDPGGDPRRRRDTRPTASTGWSRTCSSSPASTRGCSSATSRPSSSASSRSWSTRSAAGGPRSTSRSRWRPTSRQSGATRRASPRSCGT